MSISAAELTNYKLQLKTVEEAITLDPDNEELKNLAAGLKEIIEVAEGLAISSAKMAPSQGNAAEKPHQFKEGQLCETYYSGDGLWYPAKVVGISKDGLLYTVKYVDYDETVMARASSLRQIEEEKVQEIEKESRKRAAQEALAGSTDAEAKKKKFKDKKVHQEKKNEEMNQKQQSWMTFKNKVKAKQSIFASPDSLEGKVGVTNSGKGLTEFAQRKKHEFEKEGAGRE